MGKTQCFSCKSNQVNFKYILRGFKIYKCKNCDVEFVNPIPSQEDMEKYYSLIKTQKLDKQEILNTLKEFENEKNSPRRDFYENILTLIKKLKNKKSLKIAEIGSGIGLFVHYSNNQGHKAQGTEVTKRIADFCTNLINGEIYYIKNNEYLKFLKKNSYDLVFLDHVFEHLTDPKTYLDIFRQLLTENGYLIFRVPNHVSLSSKLFGKKWTWIDPPYHLYYYNPKSVKILLENSGYDVIKVETNDYFERSIPQLYSIRNWVNIVKFFLNYRLKLNLKIHQTEGKYPETIFSYINYLPYWFFAPLLKRLSDSGSEILGFFKKKSEN